MSGCGKIGRPLSRLKKRGEIMKKILFFVLISSGSALYAYGPYGYGCNWNFFPYGGFIMWIIFFAIFAVLLYLLYTLVKNKGLISSATADEPLSILKRRLASGEITEEEYERLKSKING